MMLSPEMMAATLRAIAADADTPPMPPTPRYADCYRRQCHCRCFSMPPLRHTLLPADADAAYFRRRLMAPRADATAHASARRAARCSMSIRHAP